MGDSDTSNDIDLNDEISSGDDTGSFCSNHEPEMQEREEDVFSASESKEDNGDNDYFVDGRTWANIPSGGNASREFMKYISQHGTLTEKSENIKTIEESFHLFINAEIMDIIIKYTNQKADSWYSSQENKTWKPIDICELNAFFGIILMLGRFQESKDKKADIWRQKPALSRQIYTAAMSRNRFTDILRFLRFDDFTTREERKCDDKLAALRDVTNIFARNCRDCYAASGQGTIDEQLVTFRGRCPFKVYMPGKPRKNGIKIWTLCDANSLYCCNFDVYLGKTGNSSKKSEAQRVVKQLCSFWKESGRIITTSNFFTDIALADYLLNENIFLVGTVQKNKKFLPKCLIGTYNRAEYSSQFLFTRNFTLVSYVPKRRKCAVLLSSIHHEHEISSPENKCKPEIISYYNSTKSGVDVLGKILREYTCRRSTRRWPLSLFMHYIDIAAYNALVIWKTKYPDWEKQTPKQSRRKIFLENLAEQLFSENINRRAVDIENRNTTIHKHLISAIEASGRPIIMKGNIPEETPGISRKRARCYICIGKDTKYNSKCQICSQHICKMHMISPRIICQNCGDA